MTVLFRYPHEKICRRLTAGDDRLLTFPDILSLKGHGGFVIAPFAPSAERPVVLVENAEEMSYAQPDIPLLPADDADLSDGRQEADNRRVYGEDFRLFHRQLTGGRFRKIVLARSMTVRLPETPDKETLFHTACALYPAQFITLFDTPYTGTWLVATPETLLEGSGTRWQTMALAGTRSHQTEENPDWSGKDRTEQACVAEYIRDTVGRFSDHVQEAAPVTVTAGGMDHLCSRFTFTLDRPGTDAVSLLDALHPTPAVAGLPKEAARRFILDNEHTDRLYYSGFTGMWRPDAETRLFVSLRCMRTDGHQATLYAGGGLVKDSEEEKEWRETCLKRGSMIQVLRQCTARKTT